MIQQANYYYEPEDPKYRDIRQARQLRYRASVLLEEAIRYEQKARELEERWS